MTLVAERYGSMCTNKEKMNEQVIKNLLYEKGESWWDIGFEGNGGAKSKETRVCNSKGNCHSPVFSTRT